MTDIRNTTSWALRLRGRAIQLLSAVTALGLSATMAQAVEVGDTIINPKTSANETVDAVFDGGVLTDQSNIILTDVAKGNTYSDPNDDTKSLLVDSVVIENGRITGFKVKDDSTVYPVVIDVSGTIDNSSGGGATGPGTLPTSVVPAADDRGYYDISRTGGKGADGANGGGVCILVCIVKKAESGDTGTDGTNVTETISAANPANNGTGKTITTVTDKLHGVLVTSIGGTGGEGGDFIGANIGGGSDGNAGAGGKAGAGGTATATVTSDVSITTSGKDASGLFVQSRSGKGGDAGSGYGISSGGAGGSGGKGGTANATNQGTINTTNAGAKGILSQSYGGSSGGGGDSFGLVGTAGGSLPAGDGGTANATNSGAITTKGAAAHGVLAQSVGGSGGSGGASGQLFVALQDDPAGGGDAGTTSAVNTGTISTDGRGAHGLVALSVGGNGGDGGDSGAAVVALGGSSSTGGDGGKATATQGLGGKIQTNKAGAFGIFAQSIGGGGGNGGVGGAIVALGGTGGGGGDGDTVIVTTKSGSGDTKSTIKTFGAVSHGIMAQSIGGGGGVGGVGGGLVAIGGSGGTGNDAGAVTVNNQSDIATTGLVSRGIFAESIGGGGGSANAAGAALVAVGGKGKSGGDGATVSITNSGAISTAQYSADGILAQSIGGGGGDGAVAGGLVGVGGKGDSGGAGDTVTITNSGTISTNGAVARGIYAQSIGGGGGTGGDSGGGVAVGGASSKTSDGGVVTITNSGAISTTKARADAILAQSIGGGGGDGGTSGGLITVGGKGAGGGDGKNVTITNSNDLSTKGGDANGVFAQSVGGGGGTGGSAFSGSAFIGVAVGGSGDTGGDGAKAEVILNQRTETIQGQSVKVTPKITTKEDRANGVFAQSVGGGGGNGGNTVQGTIGVFASVSVAVGGSGAKGGDGKEAKVTGNSNITTDGDDSHGIMAQSVGGGGGNGGFAISGTLTAGVKGSLSIAAGVGGTGGGAGKGGDVTLDSKSIAGSVKTSGEFSTGATIQSIGGGGGSGGYSIAAAAAFSDGVGVAASVGVGGSGGKGGKGGTVKATYKGNIGTTGDKSAGIVTQSVGGGGGNGGFSVSASVGGGGSGGVAVPIGVGGSGDTGGDGDAVTTNIAGNITTSGAQSDAVLVQSQGGGGGNGAFNVSGALSVGESGSAAIPIGVGGYGKGGGSGGTVVANVTGDITTGRATVGLDAQADEQSNGFIATSIGGGGGNGGFNVSGGISIGKGAAVGIGVGGSGGTASNGGSVTAGMTGDVVIYGQDATGILVQSAGGGGGNGAFNVTGTGALGDISGAVSIGVGGTGGKGGDGDTATLTSKGSVTTHADRSDAILVESVGGGGGNGGFNVSGSVALGSSGAAAIGFGIGGFGGDGGTSKLAKANISGGDIKTSGNSSRGVVVQSLGGGGGNGAFNVTGGIAGAKSAAGSIGVGIGGFGGTASKGGQAQATIDNSVTTSGAKSTGVLVQSVGGGGGNGAFNVTGGIAGAKEGAGVLGVGVGGFGKGGGNASAVEAIIRKAVTTKEADSTAIVIQSNGGGGGNGAFNVTGGISGGKEAAGVVGIGVGGFGGGGGNGDTVTATIRGAVTTEKDRSAGVLVQSQGGGGGNGAFNITGSATGAKGISGVGGVGVGGFGDGGGHGKTVNAKLKAPVTTNGDGAAAVTIQSLGGGGGNGAFNVTGGIALAKDGAGGLGVGVGGYGGAGGNAGRVNAGSADDPNSGNITTSGTGSHGLLVQSQGGGGGAGAFNVTGTATASGDISGAVSVGVGGKGGGGGHGDVVTAHHNGRIETDGVNAFGTTVQSVGGGGGSGAFNVSGTISLTKPSGTIAGAVGVGVGGSGGKAGNSNIVTASHTGNITTKKSDSHGLLFQSEGGGGGVGAFNVNGAITGSNLSGNLGVGVGGAGAGGGTSKSVTGALSGDVKTMGQRSPGVIMQSSGGGGGVGAFNVIGGINLSKDAGGTLGVGVGGFGGGGGSADVVTGTIKGDVTTEGEDSRAILVQSAGGGGGAGAFNIQTGVQLAKAGAGAFGLGIGGFGGEGGSAKAVSGSATGTIVTKGKNSDGILVQSQGGGGGAGGINITGNVVLSGKEGAAAAGIGIGGFGGKGGDGDTVTFTRTGSTTTEAANSHGVVIQSVGGGGGNGGLNVTGNISATAKGTSTALGFGIGGFGGVSGNASNVTARVDGDVKAMGADAAKAEEQDDGITRIVRKNGSDGIIAQSISNGGGHGGINVTGALSLSKEGGSGRAANIGIGGFGGTGGNAGEVDLTVNASTVIATGDDTSGVAAQSIGGGGGHGGIDVAGGIAMGGNATIGIGGFGGTGGTAKSVKATSTTNIAVTGANARGFVAQSVGGGGGAGGINVTAGLQKADGAKEPNITLGIGGFGGSGGTSETVTATHTGTITTTGYQSIGALVQSIGGGGGTGAINVMGNIKLGKGYAGAFNVGGSGGTGASAKDVTFTNNGAISVDGRSQEVAAAGITAPQAILPPAQAILTPVPTNNQLITDNITKAAEGIGEFAKEKGIAIKDVALNFALDAIGRVNDPSFADRANGVLVQSIGGGGGHGGINAAGVIATKANPGTFTIGGSGGASGDAGTVTVARGLVTQSTLSTQGKSAHALVAQSIGGGGGQAGVNLSGTLGNTSGKDNPRQLSFAMGGSGGNGGEGKDTKVQHSGTITTAGGDSKGILAQSIGGGGGNANYNVSFGTTKDSTGANLAIGGGTGDGNKSGKVTVDHRGAITTAGATSTAIHAQSVGGGGGNTSLNVATSIRGNNAINASIGRNGGKAADAGDVDVKSEGTLTTSGLSSDGILAQSIANGGGNSGTIGADIGASTTGDNPKSFAAGVQLGLDGADGGAGGAVTVTAGGSITTTAGKSQGIAATSLGGGGGKGGTTLALNIGDTHSALVGIGGNGGKGGIGGTVNVSSTATIATSETESHGIAAESIGGGGGTGGYAAALTYNGAANASSGANQLSVNVGGAGGDGNNGGDVTVTNSGVITTQASDSIGIKAQSLGKGGGNGGAVIAGTLGTKGGDANKMSLNIGGAAGNGSSAATGNFGKSVTVTNTGKIATKGARSAGIQASSRGGGGGNGGLVAQVRLERPDKTVSVQSYSVAIGGTGGTGDVGGTVRVKNTGDGTNTGIITTIGAEASGIYAESLGGGGGAGSALIDVAVSGGQSNQKNRYNLAFNLGGTGGKGNKGGSVNIENTGLIDTIGAKAHGIDAKSIGGGGGNGGVAFSARSIFKSEKPTGAITIGGIGGSGGDGGDVTVSNTGTITARGVGAHGIFAQSIGGGGGNSQIGIGLDLSAPKNALAATVLNTALSAGVGGIGALAVPGGKPGDVTITHQGNITVIGDGAEATKTATVNGGGGSLSLDLGSLTSLAGTPLQSTPDATTASTAPVANSTEPKDNDVALAVGGTNNKDMEGGAVTATTDGDFATIGRNSTGISDQSVGGGGGTASSDMTLVADESFDTGKVGIATTLGGTNGTNNGGGNLNGAHTGKVTTMGANSIGIFAQSIGGGGGRVTQTARGNADALGDVALKLGATDETDGSGGNITRNDQAAIETTADLALGVVLQSIGGGGGDYALSLLSDAGAMTNTAHVSLGADGGTGLSGGQITAQSTGNVTTKGTAAIGFLAQSIGGGGGLARVAGLDGAAVDLGGSNGATGNGGAVTLTNSGAIATKGVGAHGFVLQSIGGGGGTAIATDGSFTTANAAAAPAAANSGTGGDLTFIQSGTITTEGADAVGVILQSIGGGGGLISDAASGTKVMTHGGTGAGGDITLLNTGDIQTKNASSIVAQSLGGTGAGDITLNLIAGQTVSGKITVDIDGGRENAVLNFGILTNQDAIEGFALKATTGNEAVTNTGFVLGKLALGAGANSLHNLTLGEVHAGDVIDLGDAVNTFTNDGLVRPGSTEFALQAAVNGAYRQSAIGEFNGELDFATDVLDAFLATGDVAAGGTYDVDLLSIPVIKPGDFEKPLLTSQTALTAEDPTLETAPSVVILYDLVEKPTELALAFAVDFNADGLLGNQMSIGEYFNAVQTAGSDPSLAAIVTELVNAPDLPTYSNMLTQLGSEVYAEQQVRDMGEHSAFALGLADCDIRDGAIADPSKGRCFWFENSQTDMDRLAYNGFPAMEHSGRQVSLGTEFSTKDGHRLAVGFGTGSETSTGFDGAWSSSAKRFHLGAALTSMIGPNKRVIHVSVGKSNAKTSRAIDVTGPMVANSSRKSFVGRASYSLSQKFTRGAYWAEPGIDVGFGIHRASAFNETGAGALNLQVSGKTNAHLWATPSAKFGVGFDLGGASRLDLTGDLSYQMSSSQGKSVVAAGLEGAPDGVAPFAMSSAIGKGLFRAEIGAKLSVDAGMALSINYGIERSNLREVTYGAAKFSVPF